MATFIENFGSDSEQGLAHTHTYRHMYKQNKYNVSLKMGVDRIKAITVYHTQYP